MSDRSLVPMRARRRPAAALVLALAVGALAPVLVAGDAWAQASDARIKAREHYAAGRALYDNGEYEGAIREFAAADALAPSGVNDFNIALCHEKLGAAALAVQFYKSFLSRTPDAANKAEVQASIGRLEKVAAEQKKAEAAAKKKADADAKKAALEAAKAEKEAAKAAAAGAKQAEADAAKAKADADAKAKLDAEAAAKAADEAARKETEAAKRPPEPAAAPPPPAPAAAPAPSTGDPELDRAAAVDIGAIRDQRRGPAAAAPAYPGTPTGPATAAPAASTAPAPPIAPERPSPPPDKPVYKKWWFWAVVGVSAIVVISMLDDDSSSSDSDSLRTMPEAAPVSGVPLFRF
jgi:tetratricopeptide (TPR) repeat protein